MTSVSIEQLYKDFAVLADAKEDAGEHEAEYHSILSAVKGGAGEKRLASQFIARFFKYFPTIAIEAINALFDLCEDDDINIRKQAIKDLPSLCKEMPEHVPKISEALTQLLQCDDQTELSLVHLSLMNLMSINAKGMFEGVFSQILSDEEVVREKAIKFIMVKLKNLSEDELDKDTQEFVVLQCKKVLQDVTKDEFIAIMNVLKNIQCMKTDDGRQKLVDIVVEQAELDQPFEAADADCVDKLLSCIRQAIPLFSKNVHSTAFVGYICDNVIPVLTDLSTTDEGINPQLEVLKIFAEISEFCGELDNKSERIEKVYNRLIDHMPLPPPEDISEQVSTEEPKLHFSTVECLMYACHQLCRHCPEFLTDDANADRLKDFRVRLQYLARGIQVYIKQLRAALQGKTGDDLKTEENKIKVVALKTTSNINNLIKDLFHNPPAYKVTVSLSWKPPVSKTHSNGASPVAGQKRITPITYEGGDAASKKPHSERKLYVPPRDKFSSKSGSFTGGARGGARGGFSRGRGRGGFRGGY